MISILAPSRGRPSALRRMIESAGDTCSRPFEVVVRLDDDDPTLDRYRVDEWTRARAQVLVGPRIVLSQTWNECWQAAAGPIYMHASDDIVFRTPGWGQRVADAFPTDGIAFVHGDDLSGRGPAFGTHGFLRREWTDRVGTFVPPHFSSDYNDTWLNEVANMLCRRVFVPIVTEHMHFAFQKGPLDLTHAERLVRHFRDDADGIYLRTELERSDWAERLQAALA